MATYTPTAGVLVCTGTNITTDGIVAAVNTNSGSLNTVGGASATATTFTNENGYRTSTISADFTIGDGGSTASTWIAEDENISVWANKIVFDGANVRFGLKNANGTISNPVSFHYDSTQNAANPGSWERWILQNGGHFEAYGSVILCDNLLTYETTLGDVTFERCFINIEDGLGEGSGTLTVTGSPTASYVDCIMDSHVGVGLKLYQNIDYVIDRLTIANNTYGIQPGANALVLVDVGLDTNTSHSVPNVANCDVTFINPDFLNLRVALADAADVHRIGFRYILTILNAAQSPLAGAVVRISDQTGTAIVNNGISDASGKVAVPEYNSIPALLYRTYAGTTGTDRATHTFGAFAYETQIVAKSVVADQDLVDNVILLDDASITEPTKATVDAYTTLDTPNQVYDRAKAELFDAFAGETQTTVTRSGAELDARALDVVIDATAAQAFDLTGSTLTIKTSNYVGDMVTTGTITLANGATFTGTRTDQNGTVLPLRNVAITGLAAGSRVRVYNATTTTEVVNQIVAGTSYTATYAEGTGYSIGDTVQIFVTQTSGATAKVPQVSTVVAAATGWSLLVQQENDSVYNTFAVDGSGVTNFSADYANNQADVVVAANFNLSDFYAWWVYNLTTTQGIREFFGGLTAVDEGNFRIESSTLSIFLDNTTTTNIRQLDNRRLHRADGVYPVLDPTSGGGGIDVAWRNTILISTENQVAIEQARLAATAAARSRTT